MLNTPPDDAAEQPRPASSSPASLASDASRILRISRVPRPSLLVLAAAFLAVACSSNPSKDNGGHGHERGETVTITGAVVDLDNQPVAELEVVLRAARHSFDYLRFRKRKPVVREISTMTSGDGGFELQWPWDGGFNRFTLDFGVTIAEPGGEGFHVLHREDLSRRIKQASPVVSMVQIEDTSILDSFLEFRDGLTSEAQHEVYRRAGKPDKVHERASASVTFVDWWYFELGKVYRFQDGELSEVEDFEPVKSFDS